MRSIFLIRHGQASFSAANYDKLSELGQQQMQVLGEHASAHHWQVDYLVNGTMQRHFQSRDQFIAGYGETSVNGVDNAGVNEYPHENVLQVYRPEFANLSELIASVKGKDNAIEAFKKTFGSAIQRWIAGEHDQEYRESWPDYKKRCASALNDIKSQHYKNSVVITSGGVIAAMLQAQLGLADDVAMDLSWSTANASVTRLWFNDEKWHLAFYNNYSHLDEQGITTWR